MKKSEQEIRNRVLTFTKKRGPQKSVCPTEVTRDLFSDVWRDHLDEVKGVAGKMQNEKMIRVTQEMKDVSIDNAKGPIRLSLYNNNE
jgi:hypothetical protein